MPKWFLPAVLAILTAACATTREEFDAAASLERAAEDPWERTNRKVHAFNSEVDRLVIRPPAMLYQKAVPAPLQRGVRNFYNNLGEPLNLVNSLLQGKFDGATRAAGRFFVNMSLGGLGAADEATLLGFDEKPHDLGQTFAVWGIKSGPFVMLPVFGPSTVRDGIGFLGEIFLDPVRFGTGAALNSTQSLIEQGVRLLDQRAELIARGEQIRRGSADDYATVRSAWLQLRLAQLYDGDPPIADEDYE
ncbi:MlaA family lipoprotein, partial [Thermaurantiacus sp.]